MQHPLQNHIKVLANRLERLLPKCISQEQSTFVENRSILDNVLVASEILHHMKGEVQT